MNALIGHNGGPPIKLRWYQEEAVCALFDYFADPSRAYSLEPANPLICLPTGTGKSVVIAEFFRRVLMNYPHTRGIMATHVKTLIEQNANKMREVWPLAPLGINSAGLKLRESSQPLIFGGIQSMRNNAEMLGHRDLLGIDEAHLLSPNNDTSYIQFIKALTEINPYLRTIGFTATPYRLGLGLMTNGNMFTHIAYDMCNIEGFARLIADGYLCTLIPAKTKIELDVSGVGMANGDYKAGELEAACDKVTVNFQALQEVVARGQDRGSWLVFASGVQHAEHLAEMLNSQFNIPTVCIHSKKSQTENDNALELWKTGGARCAVSVNSLTTGVDHPALDLIVIMRPTMSPGLWVQMLGRGTRPFSWFLLSPAEQLRLIYFRNYVKPNCLVLDFAGNTRKLGPINDPVIPKLRGEGPPGDAPVRLCPTDRRDENDLRGCGTYNHASAKECVVCGFIFPINNNLSKVASDLELLRSDLPEIVEFPVSRSVIVPHQSKASGNNSIKVAYYCKLRTFFEYISVESKSSFFRHKSRDWFRQRYHYENGNLGWEDDVPSTNQEILNLNQELRCPSKIKVWINTEPPQIIGYEF